MTAEVYRAAGELMRDAGKLAGVADEGGWWPAFDTNEEALAMLVRAIERAGFVPGDDVAISLDVAASEFGRDGRYRLGLERREARPRRDDRACCSAGSTATRSCRSRIRSPRTIATAGSRSRAPPAARADHRRRLPHDERRTRRGGGGGRRLQRRADQAEPGRHAHRDARGADAGRHAGFATIVSARSGETEDTSIVHLAIGWNAGQLKVGSFARSERMAKWNEALRIEESLGAAARYAGRAALAPRAR